MISRSHILCWAISAAFPLPMLAQPGMGSDSAYTTWQSRTNTRMSHRNSTMMLASGMGDVAQVKLGVTRQWGSFRQARDPQYHTDVSFYTEGIRTIKKFRLEGSFEFNKVWDDSLANTLTGPKDDAQPFFLFAHKAGKYERQDYRLKATIAYPLAGNRLFLATGIDYFYHWTTRSVDPRLDVKYFHLMLKPEISWRFGRNILGGHVVWGYGNEEDAITYKNRNFSGNTFYVDRNSFISQGYGSREKMRDALYRINDFYGAGVSYGWSKDAWSLKWTNQYSLKEEDNTPNDFSQEYMLYGMVQTESVESDLILEKKLRDKRHQLRVYLSLQNTINYASIYSGVNYQYQGSRLRAEYMTSRNKWAGAPEFGLTLDLDRTEKEDMAAEHQVSYTYVQPQIRLAAHKKGRGGMLRAAIAPGVYLPLETYLYLPPTQEKDFTRWVVYPDHLYWSAKAVVCDAELLYFPQDLLKNTSAAFSARTSLRTLMPGFEGKSLPGTPPVSGIRGMVELGFSLFL